MPSNLVDILVRFVHDILFFHAGLRGSSVGSGSSHAGDSAPSQQQQQPYPPHANREYPQGGPMMEAGWSEGGGRGPRPPHAGNPNMHHAAAAAAGYDQRGPYPGPNYDARVSLYLEHCF